MPLPEDCRARSRLASALCSLQTMGTENLRASLEATSVCPMCIARSPLAGESISSERQSDVRAEPIGTDPAKKRFCWPDSNSLQLAILPSRDCTKCHKMYSNNCCSSIATSPLARPTLSFAGRAGNCKQKSRGGPIRRQLTSHRSRHHQHRIDTRRWQQKRK